MADMTISVVDDDDNDLSGCTCSDIAVCSYEPSFPSAQAPDLSLEAEGHVPFVMTKLASSGSNMV